MAGSICVKCAGNTFERGRITPLGEQRAIAVLQCAGCGTVISVIDEHQAIEPLYSRVEAIDAGLVRIAKALSEI